MSNKKNTEKKFGDFKNLEALITNEVDSYLIDIIESVLTERDPVQRPQESDFDPASGTRPLTLNTPREKFVALLQAVMIPYLPYKFFEKHGYSPSLVQSGFGPNGEAGAGLSFVDGKLGKVTKSGLKYILNSSIMKYEIGEADNSHAWLDQALGTVIKILKQRRKRFDSEGKEFDKYGDERAKAKLETMAFGKKNLSVIDKRISGEEDNLFIKTQIDPLIFIGEYLDGRNANQTIKYLRHFYSGTSFSPRNASVSSRNVFRAKDYIKLYRDYEKNAGFTIPEEERVTPEFIAQKAPDTKDVGVSTSLGASIA